MPKNTEITIHMLTFDKILRLHALALTGILFLTSASCDKQSTSSELDERWTWKKGVEDKTVTGAPYYPKSAGATRIMTYNVGAFSKYMDNSTDMVAEMILESEADVVGLNELDSLNDRHKVYQLAQLASALGGWNYYYGRAMSYRNGAYGNGVVVPKTTRILDSYTITLPKGTGSEQRSIAVIETERYILGAAHLDHSTEESVLSQMAVVNSWAQGICIGTDKPIFFCGDMNTTQTQNAFQTLTRSWDMISNGENSAGGNNPATRCIDFVFHYKKSGPVKVLGSHTMTKFYKGDVTKASDHLPVYADVSF